MIRPNGLLCLLYLLLSTAALCPLLFVTVPPLVDYPNHLARMQIIAEWAGSPALQKNYTVDWGIIPNLAMDAVVPWLTGLLSVYDAGRLFIALALLSVIGGVCALHRAVHGAVGLSPLASFLIVYNLPLGWGFLNFYASVGLFLLIFAGWIASARWPHLLRLAVFSAAAAMLFLAHLMGFLAYGLSVVLFELREQRRDGQLARRAAVAIGQFVLPGLLLLLMDVPAGEFGPAPASWYGDGIAKVTALASPFLLYGGWPDLATIAFVAVVVCVGVALRSITLAPPLRLHVAAFLFLVIASPHVLRGVWVDARLAFVLACILAAGVRLKAPAPQLAMVATVTLVALFTVKLAAVTAVWQQYDREFAEFRAAAFSLPEGARLLAAYDTGDWKPPVGEVHWYMGILAMAPNLGFLPYRNLPALSVIDRSVFFPSMFMFPAAQPLRSAPSTRHIDPIRPTPILTVGQLVGGPGIGHDRAYWTAWRDDFDYVVVFSDEPRNPLPDILREHAGGSFFSIYEVRRNVS